MTGSLHTMSFDLCLKVSSRQIVEQMGAIRLRQEYRSSSCMSLLSVTALKRTKNIVANDDVEFAVAA